MSKIICIFAKIKYNMVLSNQQIGDFLFGTEDSPQSEDRKDFIETAKKVGIFEALWMQSCAIDTLIDRVQSLSAEIKYLREK